MNLGACPSLRTGAENAVWYRAIQPQFAAAPLGAAHTVFNASRFSPASPGRAAFRLLYLTENQVVALYEVEALYGSSLIPNPQAAWMMLNVRVTLQGVADLTGVTEQAKLGTTAQELTGDWEGYLRRNARTPVRQPTGPAPTQDLGEALYQLPGLEGFLTVSAKMPTHRILIVFPDKLRRGSSIVYTDPATGRTHTIQP
jgi:hypothetical protein